MIRRLSCVACWLLLLFAILVSPGVAADCVDPFCSIKLWSATLERDDSGKVTGGVPATFAYNNLWNTRGARGHQTLTAGSEALWSTEWDWKRGQGYTVTSYVSTVSGWHWGEINEGPPPSRARCTASCVFWYTANTSLPSTRSCRRPAATALCEKVGTALCRCAGTEMHHWLFCTITTSGTCSAPAKLMPS